MRLLPRWTNYVEEGKEGKEGKEGNDTHLNQNVIDDYYINLIINYVEEGKESIHKHLPQHLHSKSHRSAITIWKYYVLMDSDYVLLDSVWSLPGFVTNLERFWDLNDMTLAAEVTSSILNDNASFDFIAML